MFKVELKNQEGELLESDFQQVDYPLINLRFTSDKAITTRILEEVEPDGIQKITTNYSIDITLPESVFQNITGELPGYSKKELSPPAQLIIDEIKHCRCHPKFKNVYLRTKITELFILLLSSTPVPPESSLVEKEKSVFTHLKYIIGQNLKKNYSITELADIAGMNRTKMQAGFKAHFGKTIYTYTLDLKMDKAKELLIGERDVSLKEIAYLLGYRHANHFSAAFKKKFAISPSLFKKGCCNIVNNNLP